MSLSLFRILLCAAAAALSGPGQESVHWLGDFKSGLKEAAAAKKPVLLVFTVGRYCPTCRDLEKKVFSAAEYAEKAAAAFVHVKLDYAADAGEAGCDRSRMVLAASARLKGYPTICLTDQEGWPFFVHDGYEGEDAGPFADVLLRARADAGKPGLLRARGEAGMRELLEWYGARGIHLGETLAAAALWPKVSCAERIELAPLVIAAAAAKDGIAGIRPHLEVLAAAEPRNPCGREAEALNLAGSQLLRRQEFEDAARLFERLLALEDAAERARLDAELALGYAYRKLDAPCLAREHYGRGIALAAKSGSEESRQLGKHAEAQMAKIAPCAANECVCPSKKQAPEP